MGHDFHLTDCGTVLLLRPNTESAQDWIDRSVSPEATWFGGSVVVERRFIDFLLEGITSDNLSVFGDLPWYVAHAQRARLRAQERRVR
jgi:hypothetical protein